MSEEIAALLEEQGRVLRRLCWRVGVMAAVFVIVWKVFG